MSELLKKVASRPFVSKPIARGEDDVTFGENGERVIIEWLRRPGIDIVPCCDFNGRARKKAPMMLRHNGALILPDLLCQDDDFGWFWAEVKSKARTSRNQTGCDQRSWEAYRRLIREKKQPVLMLWWHAEEGLFLAGDVSEMQIHHSGGFAKNGRFFPMVYFSVSSLYSISVTNE